MNAGKPTGNPTYFMSGSMFVAPGQQTWDLVDLKIEGGLWDSDTVSFLLDTSSVVDKNKEFYYISYAEADGDSDYIGWWYNSGIHAGEKVVTFPIPAGTAFMCKFFQPGTKILYAGEVVKGVEGKITIERANGQVYRFVSNPSPVPVDLTKVVIEGGLWDSDVFSFFLPNASVVDNEKAFYYISYAEADGDSDYIGWWYNSGEKAGERVVEGDVVLQPGEGFMAKMFKDGSKIIFPAPAL